MRKFSLSNILIFTFVIAFIGITYVYNQPVAALSGSYLSEDINGYQVQISIDTKDNSYVQYINQREVDKGKIVEVSDNSFNLVSELQDQVIKLNNDNTFTIELNKLSNQDIILKNTSYIPTYYSYLEDSKDFIQYLN